MSAWSAAYHAMPRKDQEFCHNWALRSSFYCTPFIPADPYDPNSHFATLGSCWTGATGADVAHSNLNVQYFIFGDCVNRPMVLYPAGYGFNENDEPARDIFAMYCYWPQFEWVPMMAFNYPRPFFKARRSYWTGAPRRRRNLSS
jgi:hypothetical protein